MQQLDVHTLLYMHTCLDGYVWELCALSFLVLFHRSLDQINETPLVAAIIKGDLDAVQCLLGSAGAEVNIALMKSVSGVMLMPME